MEIPQEQHGRSGVEAHVRVCGRAQRGVRLRVVPPCSKIACHGSPCHDYRLLLKGNMPAMPFDETARRPPALLPGLTVRERERFAARSAQCGTTRRFHLGSALLAFFVLCCCTTAAQVQDAQSGSNAAGRNLSEQEELAGGMDAVEQCAIERSKLNEERAKFETAQVLLSIKDESVQDLIARNRELESAVYEGEKLRRKLEVQLEKVTAVNVTGDAVSEQSMRKATFAFAERLAADAMHTEPDVTEVMDMAERLLEVLRGATGDAVAKERLAARVAANSGRAQEQPRENSMDAGVHAMRQQEKTLDPIGNGPQSKSGERWRKEEDVRAIGRKEIFSKHVMEKLKEEVREMFYDSFDSYMQHAYPYDELRPLTCSRKNVFGTGAKGYALTLIDSLDTLAVLGDIDRFDAAVRRVIQEVKFDVDVNVSVFETNIRAVGGLLSAHFLALRFLPWYAGELLKMCVDLADRCVCARARVREMKREGERERVRARTSERARARARARATARERDVRRP